MPRTEEYRCLHEHATPEPHCKPGYTGYLPGYGPRRSFQMGQTFERMTGDIMAAHPVAGCRLANILDNSERERRRQETDFFAWKHAARDLTLRPDMVSGYTGHVPRKEFRCGQTYPAECKSGLAEFEKLQSMMRREQAVPLHGTPQDDLMPRAEKLPERLFARPQHREVPNYATFTNPMNYGQSVYDMSDLDPRKTYMPGYTGYYTGKCFDTGVTHAAGAHQDLCDLTAARLERLVADKRPKVEDWYHAVAPRGPDKVLLEGYQPPALRLDKPMPGYAGHVPGHRDLGHGTTFGNSAQSIGRERELRFYDGLRQP